MHTPLLATFNKKSYNQSGDQSSPQLDSTSSTVETAVNMRPLDPYGLVYAIFFLSGVAMLLPWNVFITADGFFSMKFHGSRYEKTFQNFFSATSSTTNLLGLSYALATQNKKFLYSRSATWLKILAVTFVFLIILSQVSTFSPETNFWLALSLLLMGALSCAFLSSDVIALAATLDPIYVQAALAGQALAGLAVALAQLSIALSADKQDNLDKETVITQGLWYFSSALATTLFAAFGFYYLPQHALFQYVQVELSAPTEEEEGGVDSQLTSFQKLKARWILVRSLVKEQQSLIFCLFFTFTVTLAVFPGLTASVRPTQPIGAVASQFVTLGFVVYNFGDLLGRYLPTLGEGAVSSPKGVMFLTLGRLTLIPIFLLSNLDLGEGLTPAFPPWLANDGLFFFALLTLAITNGYLGTILMMAAPSRTANARDRGTMASVTVLTLALGLAAGALFSFPIRSIACACNPF